MHPRKKRKKTTSWEGVSRWYNKIVGSKGHYYHQHVVLPNLLKMIGVTKSSAFSLLDLASGQGVFSRHLPPTVDYHGVEISASLVKSAKQQAASHCRFSVGDVTQPLPVKKKDFDVITIILALQDIQDMGRVFENVKIHLKRGGKLYVVLNHPCFRIPRQSHWGVDEQQKVQYRRLDRYLSPLTIPIRTEPSKGERSPTVSSHHRSLSDLTSALFEEGLAVTRIEEWVSDKKSTGPKARMEDRARQEFPLFMAFEAIAL